MSINVNVEFRARDAEKAVDRGDLIIVVDALRFGSSVVNALANGAKTVIPTKSLKEAYRLHSAHPDWLLAGERRGVRPRGFDFGNSPLEFIREKISGKTLIFTTTSGTLALTRSKTAKWILIGVFLNAKAVAEKAIEITGKDAVGISLVQSGTRGRFSLEDFVCAGAIIDKLSIKEAILSDGAFAALLAFQQARNNLCETILKTEHAKSLINIGFKSDVEVACQLDLFPVVPIYKDGVINLFK